MVGIGVVRTVSRSIATTRRVAAGAIPSVPRLSKLLKRDSASLVVGLAAIVVLSEYISIGIATWGLVGFLSSLAVIGSP